MYLTRVKMAEIAMTTRKTTSAHACEDTLDTTVKVMDLRSSIVDVYLNYPTIQVLLHHFPQFHAIVYFV